ncbi:MAG TPA: S1/P1 nuclease [Candidatus Dormibacteraeota bacterium]|nr:S1/P1 nuclease [Candidatus Dormibacteraeota bacterium]
MVHRTAYVLMVSVACVILCRVDHSLAWWDKGHEIIAKVAADRLNAHAKAAVKEILKNDPTGHTLVAVSGWADTVRKTPMPETYNWHFVDIPLDGQPATYDAARDCQATPKGDCIIAALNREVPLLTDPSASPVERAQALKFVTHFVGDLHQPLHCAERNGDAGGNGVQVTFFGATHEAPPFQTSLWNLHAVWDGGMIDHTQCTRTAYVHRLEEWIATQDVTAIENGTFVDWANETHGQAVHHAYKTANGSQDFPATKGKIGKRYQDANIGVVDQQLAKAGVRLAKVLNDAFP